MKNIEKNVESRNSGKMEANFTNNWVKFVRRPNSVGIK